MSGLVFTAVLIAALLHASWNAMVKGARDKQLNMIAVVIGHVPLAIVVLLLAPAPIWPACHTCSREWGCILATSFS